jgi:hypothetical protein
MAKKKKKNMGLPDSEYSLYGTTSPSLAAAALFLALFSAVLVATYFIAMRFNKAWWFLTIGPALEVAAFASRVPSVKNPYSISDYLITNILAVIAPQTSAAVCYILFGACILSTDENLSKLPARYISLIWLTIDGMTGGLQGAGSGQLYNFESWERFRLGLGLTFAGMTLQWVFFCVFTYFAYIFFANLKRTPVYYNDPAYRRPAMALMISSVCHIIRYSYRIGELAAYFSVDSFSTILVIPEVYYYVFDALPMLIANTIIVIYFPYKMPFSTVHGPFSYIYGRWKERRQQKIAASHVQSDPKSVEA